MSARRGGHMRNRREFLGLATAAGAAGLVGLGSRTAAAEPPPETTKLRLLRSPSICWAPQYIAGDLLQAKGFTEVPT
jgi:NitT/TauT family transport system substrate-binding protein